MGKGTIEEKDLQTFPKNRHRRRHVLPVASTAR